MSELSGHGGSLPGLAAMYRSAAFSEDRRYRYSLTRCWEPGPLAVFVGLNPSTANEEQDDPTIRRCIRFARDWGYGGLRMVNLFGLVSAYPKALLAVDDPVGPGNDESLRWCGQHAGVVIAAWGSFPQAAERAEHVISAGILGDYRYSPGKAMNARRPPELDQEERRIYLRANELVGRALHGAANMPAAEAIDEPCTGPCPRCGLRRPDREQGEEITRLRNELEGLRLIAGGFATRVRTGFEYDEISDALGVALQELSLIRRRAARALEGPA